MSRRQKGHLGAGNANANRDWEVVIESPEVFLIVLTCCKCCAHLPGCECCVVYNISCSCDRHDFLNGIGKFMYKNITNQLHMHSRFYA